LQIVLNTPELTATQIKILISGAGIAGSALAFWLSKLGHAVSIMERIPSLHTSGLQVDLRGHGVEVLKRMGLERQSLATRAKELGTQVVDSSGRRRALSPANMSGKGVQGFTTKYKVIRGDLCRLLYDDAADRTKYICRTRIERYEQKNDTVEVIFVNGRADSFDLLVGADSQGSRTRKIMLGYDIADRFYSLKDSGAYFTLLCPMQVDKRYVAIFYMATDWRRVMTRGHYPDKIQV
jgi:2-polyprenyl-6-methoxyphenol hydroxylase-like FAD-dependent oxidoreductase